MIFSNKIIIITVLDLKALVFSFVEESMFMYVNNNNNIIIIMVIFKCYFSGELIALS